jgi:hypothetical protein
VWLWGLRTKQVDDGPINAGIEGDLTKYGSSFDKSFDERRYAEYLYPRGHAIWHGAAGQPDAGVAQW